VEPAEVVKTLVVRRSDDDYVLVLVPGDREVSEKKLAKRYFPATISQKGYR
jgi:prolyl-tRNA editing enzyme YbaK/EbsC (Cys-tRNA(Pro) deacylase)